jgi:hypothetical protein
LYLPHASALLTIEDGLPRTSRTEENPMHAPIRMTTIVSNMLDSNSPRLVTPRRRPSRRNR